MEGTISPAADKLWPGQNVLCSRASADILLGFYDRRVTLEIMRLIAGLDGSGDKQAFTLAETILSLEPDILRGSSANMLDSEQLRTDHDGSPGVEPEHECDDQPPVTPREVCLYLYRGR